MQRFLHLGGTGAHCVVRVPLRGQGKLELVFDEHSSVGSGSVVVGSAGFGN